jgi:F0F1-type ATP synthase membrane subunit b/b'
MTNLLQRTRFRVAAVGSILLILSFDLLPPQLKSACDNLMLVAFAVLLVLVVIASIWLPIETRALKHRSEMLQLGQRTAEERLDELERLKRRDMVTSEEYAAKRRDILEDL